MCAWAWFHLDILNKAYIFFDMNNRIFNTGVSLSRLFVWLSAFMMLGLSACKKDDGDMAFFSELGTAKAEFIVTSEAGSVAIDVYSNDVFRVQMVDTVDWIHLERLEDLRGDTSFLVQYDGNDGLARMAQLALYAPAANRYDTIVIRQRGTQDPKIAFPKSNTTAMGTGGTVTNVLNTNVPFEDIRIDVIYPEAGEEWVNNDYALDPSSKNLSFSVKPNPDQVNLRNAQIRLSYTDGWKTTHTTTLYVLQANALNRFGTEVSFADLRQLWAGEQITSYIYLEGHVISDAGNKNMGDNARTTNTAINYAVNDRTAYVQSLDGRFGFRIETTSPTDNIFTRYSKVQVLLKGATIHKINNPESYYITGITSAMVMSQEQGAAANLVMKQKYMSELTDQDLYTYVTLKDCEFPVRKGSFTPINEGYSPLFNAHRINKYPLLMRDIQGNSMHLLTNMNVPYRRDGSMLPYGSGTVSGVLVHEKFVQFEYEDAPIEEEYGNIGRYQLRHVSRNDIRPASDLEQGFSALLTEYRYPKLVSGIAQPTFGNNGSIKTSNGASIGATSDYSYLGPCGSSFLGNTNQYGNGVMEGSSKQNTSTSTNSDGKGGTALSGLGCNSAWWNAEKNRGEAWIVEVSTSGISTDQLSLQFTAANWSNNPGGPRFWKVEWSEHGDMDGAWKTITTYTVPDLSNWSNTLMHQLPGFKNINVALPLEMLGKSKVFIRLIVDKNLGGSGNTYASQPLPATCNTALGYLAIRYNK